MRHITWELPAAILVVLLFFGFSVGALWLYAQWGGGCIERGGKIVDGVMSTRCEGGR